MAPTHDPRDADASLSLSAEVRTTAAGPLGGAVVAAITCPVPQLSERTLLAWWRCEAAALLDGPPAQEFVLDEGRAELVWRPFAHRRGTVRGVLIVVDPGPPARVVLEHAHEFELASDLDHPWPDPEDTRRAASP